MTFSIENLRKSLHDDIATKRDRKFVCKPDAVSSSAGDYLSRDYLSLLSTTTRASSCEIPTTTDSQLGGKLG